jgi:CRP-like cAMP-binding protein
MGDGQIHRGISTRQSTGFPLRRGTVSPPWSSQAYSDAEPPARFRRLVSVSDSSVGLALPPLVSGAAQVSSAFPAAVDERLPPLPLSSVGSFRVPPPSHKIRQYEAGQVVFWEGDGADGVYVNAKGTFALLVASPCGTTVVVDAVPEGEIFGEYPPEEPMCKRPFRAIAVGPAAAWKVRHTEVPLNDPDVSRLITNGLARRAAAAGSQLAASVALPASLRVLRTLLLIWGAGRYRQQGKPQQRGIAISQGELASICGVSRTVVNRVLGEEHQRGTIIVSRKWVTLVDPETLHQRMRGNGPPE